MPKPTGGAQAAALCVHKATAGREPTSSDDGGGSAEDSRSADDCRRGAGSRDDSRGVRSRGLGRVTARTAARTGR